MDSCSWINQTKLHFCSLHMFCTASLYCSWLAEVEGVHLKVQHIAHSQIHFCSVQLYSMAIGITVIWVTKAFLSAQTNFWLSFLDLSHQQDISVHRTAAHWLFFSILQHSAVLCKNSWRSAGKGILKPACLALTIKVWSKSLRSNISPFWWLRWRSQHGKQALWCTVVSYTCLS